MTILEVTTMRLFIAAIAGSFIGALAGLAWFLVELLRPSTVPVNLDGGGSVVVLLFIAAGFAAAGGLIGCLLGPFLAMAIPRPPKAFPRTSVPRTCSHCGHHATNEERAVSALCARCREPLFSCADDHRMSHQKAKPYSAADE